MAGDNFIENSEQKPAAVKVFNCPSCGAGVKIRAAGQSVTAVCAACASIIDSSNENYKVLEKSSIKGKRDQIIPLGQRGKLRGVLWKVIGYMERSDGSSVYNWSEYLLFNPMKGFRWLTEFDGHWNYVITTKTKPAVENLGRRKASYLNKDYFLFHSGTARVIYVIGEFYWQVKQHETVQVEDYVSPPEILSSETSDKEIIWSLGEYVEADEIKSAFQVVEPMPLQSGVAPNQPSTVSGTASYAGKYWAAFLGILFLIQILSMMAAKNETVYSGQFFYSSSDTEKIKVTPQFEIGRGMSNLEITVSSAVQNTWFEVQSDLVNDANGQTEEFEQGVEYFSGRDSDGAWSEGSQYSTVLLSSVPAGKYHLNLEASGPAIPVLAFKPITEDKAEVVTRTNYESGKIMSEIRYKNGEKNGSYKVFNEDGTLQQSGSHSNGKLHGNIKWYDANGAVTRNVNYSNGVEVSGSINPADSVSLNVTIKRDVTTWSNFLWALSLVSFFPLFVLWRNRSFEMNRWSQSDFSPYYQEGEEED